MSTNLNKEVIQRANEAFSMGDMKAFLEYCSDDIRWTMVGMPAWEGKDAILESMRYDEYTGAPIFNVKHIVAEGDIVVCDGDIQMTKKTGEVITGAYCDIYRLEDGVIKELNSYMVEFK